MDESNLCQVIVADLELAESKTARSGSLLRSTFPPKGHNQKQNEETMKTVRHCAVLVFFLAACTALTFADEPGRHPAYLHALTDLRHARAHLGQLAPTDHMDNEEQHAIEEIDKAIWEIKHAAIDDGKELE